MANRIPQIDYYPTEAEIARMLSSNGWRMMFARDYASIKGNISNVVTATEGNSETIESLDVRLDAAELQITAIVGRVDALQNDLANHVAATNAHGAIGNIVGTGNAAQAAVRGVVLLGSAVANASASAVTPPAALAAAPAAYAQAYAQSQTAAINALAVNVADLQTALNGAITQLNALLVSQRNAGQIAP